MSSTNEHELICSFLEIALGQTVETARNVLQATHWVLDDAVQLFYLEEVARPDLLPVSSFVENLSNIVVCTNENLSNIEPSLPGHLYTASDLAAARREKRPVSEISAASLLSKGDPVCTNFTLSATSTWQQTDTEVALVALLSRGAPAADASAPVVARRKRRTRAEMEAASAAAAAFPPTTRRKRRTCAEMDAASQASGVTRRRGRVCVEMVAASQATGVTRRRGRARVEVAPVALLSGAGPVAPATAPIVARRKRRTRAEIVAASQASTAGLLMSGITTSTKRARGRALVEGQSPPPINPQASFDDVEYLSRRARSPSIDATCSRQSKRLRGLQENFPCERPACAKKRLAIGDQWSPAAATPMPPANDCSKCGAVKLAFETPTFCCSRGQVHLVQNELPSELLDLYGGTGDNARHFRDYARMYNNTFAFSSLGGSAGATTQKGIYVFQLHGQLYHNVPELTPENKSPSYLQLYFYDSQAEKQYRNCIFPEIEAAIVDILMEVTERNPYAKFFRSLRELPVSEHTKIALSHNPSLDQRVYNAPSSDEVGAIFVERPGSSAANSPHILVHGRGDASHRVMHYYGCYDPLQYPLLHPNGECGWHQGIKKIAAGGQYPYTNPTFPLSDAPSQTATDLFTEEATSARMPRARSKDKEEVSCRQYYAYKIQMRTGNYLLKTGRVFQQYIVDMYVKIENTRLDYLRHNQATLRADLYQGVLDSLGAGETDAAHIGHRIILPPSFIGGPRDVKRRYLNAMALVQKFGKPDLFITMTCNPNWPEIKEQLLPGEKSEDRPDVVARVFRAKLTMLKNEINKKRVFGAVAARVDVVEFQKRGLPHAHLLIILEEADKNHKS